MRLKKKNRKQGRVNVLSSVIFGFVTNFNAASQKLRERSTLRRTSVSTERASSVLVPSVLHQVTFSVQAQAEPYKTKKSYHHHVFTK